MFSTPRRGSITLLYLICGNVLRRLTSPRSHLAQELDENFLPRRELLADGLPWVQERRLEATIHITHATRRKTED